MKHLLARFVRQSPTMVVAMLALFVALTGTAVATTSALITGNQIKNSSITGADIKNKSLTPKDFKGSVRGARGTAGAQGAQGLPGAQGPQGLQGEAGATNVTVRYIDRNIPATGSVLGQVASCAAGERAVAGGYSIFGINVSTVHVGESRPNPATQGAVPTGWSTWVYNPTAIAAGDIRIYVLCASP